MKVSFDLNSISDYRKFLKVKSLPQFRIVGRTAEFPDEYAHLLGEKTERAKAKRYAPIDGLFDYQGAIAKLAIRKQKFAAFMGCGMGKTLVMLEFARHVQSVLPRDRAILIVSPLMVVRQTLDEAERFYGRDLHIEQLRAKDLSNWLEKGSGIGITNYDAIVDGLPTGKLSALILDESAMLKSAYGKWGTRLIEMGKGLDWKLCLTGLPAPNDRIEYANHAVFLDHFPTVNSFLARFFVNRGQTDNRWELKPHALRPFYRALSHWSIFLNDPSVYGWKDNVGTTPPIEVHIDPVELSSDQWEAAREESKSLFPVAGGITSRARLSQIAKGNHKGKKIETSKPAFVKNYLNQWPNESTIIWCRYNHEQDELASMIPEAANISGSTPYEKRSEMIRAFQSGQCKTLISKAECLGFGLNLQICTRMIFSTLIDSYEDYHQCVKRANRFGSTNPLHVYLPITEIERPMVATVLEKAKRVEHDTMEQEKLFREVAHEFR